MCITRIKGHNNEAFEGETSMTIAHTFFKHLTTFWRIAAVSFLMSLAACNNGGGGGPGSGNLSLFAGNLDAKGNTDATGVDARFLDVRSGAFDATGKIYYVADASNHTIRKITSASGVVTTVTLAGLSGYSGSADGTGPLARFNNPSGVSTDGAGNVYVADTGNNAIRKITPAGVVSTYATNALIIAPQGVASDTTGANVYVASTGNHLILDITYPAGVLTVTTFAGGAAPTPGAVDGIGAAASFNTPQALALDKLTPFNLYVADTGNNKVRSIATIGTVGNVITLAGTYNSPQGVAVNGNGDVYVADTNTHTIRIIPKTGTAGVFAGAGNYGSANGPLAQATFYNPTGVAVDSLNNVYVADKKNFAIRKIDSVNVSTFAGMAGMATMSISGITDGSGASANFDSTNGVASDSAGNLYVADTNNHTIRKITPAGLVSTFAGTPKTSGSGGGIGGVFSSPGGVAIDSADNLYVADTGNNIIRKMNTTGGAPNVTTLAGVAGAGGYFDGAGTSALFNAPQSLTTDSAGNVYVADTGNHNIRKILPNGTVSTFAGSTASTPVSGIAEGNGSAARFNKPWGIVGDSAGNLYVTDNGNNTIRRISATGDVTTIAGKAGIPGYADGGGVARFNSPKGIVKDSSGNLYVADYFNHTIRKITPQGIVSTVTGVAGQGGFVTGALPGNIAFPQSMALVGSSLYFTMSNGVAVVRNMH